MECDFMKCKKVLMLFLAIFLSFNLFAVSNPYSTADKKTKKILSDCDALIEKAQYESAYKALNVGTANEYIIAKKIELVTAYFSQSIMHQLFALSDLEEGQTLYEVRTGDGSFSMIMADPVKMVEEYVSANGEKPILNYALGIYYSSVLNCYGSNWLQTQEEIIQNMVNYYQKAFDQKCYTSFALSELAISYLRLGDYDKGIQMYEFKKKIKEEFTTEDNYNYGYLCYLKQDYDKALPLLLQSVKDYKDNPDYLFDTYFLLSALYINSSRYEDGESALQSCISLYDNDYRIYERQIILYAITKDKEKIMTASKKLFSMAPTNPSAPQMVMNNYFNYGVAEWIDDFFIETEEIYKDDPVAMQNLTFHHSASLGFLGRKEEAKLMAETARKYFIKNDALTDQISEQLDSFSK